MDWARCVFSTLEDDYTLVVDLMLDDDGVVLPDRRYYGELRTQLNHCYPIVFLEHGGVVDNGSTLEDDARYNMMKLHNEQVFEGSSHTYCWGDGEADLELLVVSLETLSSDRSQKKTGRPPKTEAWTAMMIEIALLGKDGRLCSGNFNSQDALMDYLQDQGVGLHKDTMKTRVSQLWRRLDMA